MSIHIQHHVGAPKVSDFGSISDFMFLEYGHSPVNILQDFELSEDKDLILVWKTK